LARHKAHRKEPEMAAAFLIALQAAAAASPAPAAPTPVAPIPLDFDLARAAQAADCGIQSSALIVVCGRLSPRNAYPLEEMARRYERGPLRAEFGVGGATGRVYTEQVDFGMGNVSRRVMFGIRSRF
jgi:hypothetical protein